MSARRVAFLAVLGALGAVVILAPAAPGGAQSGGLSPYVVEGPLRLSAGGGAAMEVSDTGRYGGVVEVAADGPLTLGVVNEVGLEDYVAGVAEMPASWPAAALQAQAVAARTYALWDAGRPGWGGKVALRYDICGTTQCQVYGGLDKASDPRWRAAVEATAGLVLLDPSTGGPALARYSAIAGGRTRPNQDVFIGEGTYPYLQPVDTPEEEGVAPLSQWRVVVPRDELVRVMAATEEIRPRGDLSALSVAVPPEGDGVPTQVVIDGTGGRRVVRASTFARTFSETAERLFPQEFPGGLPSTFPSSRFSLALGPERLVVDGRGYGHGVGMSQYGAFGMAQAGASFDAILAHYYGGLAPASVERTAPLRVAVAEERKEVTITPEAPASMVDGLNRPIVDGVTAAVRVVARGDGSLVVWLPADMAPPPRVGKLDIERTEALEDDLPGLRVVVSSPMVIAVIAVGPATVEGEETEIGPGRSTVPLPPLAAGAWRVSLAQRPEAGSVPLVVTPRPPPAVGPTAESQPSRSRRGMVILLLGVAAAVAILVIVVAIRLGGGSAGLQAGPPHQNK